MEENHVAFPWGATIISGGEGLDGAKQGERMQAQGEKVPPRGYQQSDQRPSLGHYTCYRRLGTAHYI